MNRCCKVCYVLFSFLMNWSYTDDQIKIVNSDIFLTHEGTGKPIPIIVQYIAYTLPTRDYLLGLFL